MNTRNSCKPVRSLAVSLAILSLCLSGNVLAAETAKNQSQNEKLTSQAWEAYNRSDFDTAIRTAAECITLFRHTADRMQASMKNEPVPPTGRVKSEDERRKIFDRGPLNDVATCYFIQGESYRKLAEAAKEPDKSAKLAQARQAYESAAKYTYARTWDPSIEIFWDPAQTANDRLDDLPPAR